MSFGRTYFRKKDLEDRGQIAVCDKCYNVDDWHYANPTNSSMFCNKCGTWCSALDMEYEAEFRDRHKKYVSERGSHESIKFV